MTKVALSGAGGNMGRTIRVGLQKRGVDLRSAGGRTPLTPLHEGEDIMHGDLRDPAVVDRLLNGVDVLIHLAGTSVERPLPEIIENNLVGLYQVYEGARRNKVRRVIFASSNHAFGMVTNANYRPPRAVTAALKSHLAATAIPLRLVLVQIRSCRDGRLRL